MSARPPNRYELLTCAWSGHVLVGLDAATVTKADAALVRAFDGLRWHRCLRCDSWVPKRPPAEPTREHLPSRHEIELPLRGPLLRDRTCSGSSPSTAPCTSPCSPPSPSSSSSSWATTPPSSGTTHRSSRPSAGRRGPIPSSDASGTTSASLPRASTRPASASWPSPCSRPWRWWSCGFTRRWAEYLTFLATAVLLPLEVYELSSGVSVLKILTFAINLAIAVYLLWAKRLFGLNGGGRAEQERRVLPVTGPRSSACQPAGNEGRVGGPRSPGGVGRSSQGEVELGPGLRHGGRQPGAVVRRRPRGGRGAASVGVGRDALYVERLDVGGAGRRPRRVDDDPAAVAESQGDVGEERTPEHEITLSGVSG